VRTNRSRFVPLGGLSAADQQHSGAKAYNCARLAQAGFPVPDGLVVLSGASDAEIAALAAHPWFDAQGDEARFAVRSSGIGEDGAGESFAGIHQTLLDVHRADVSTAVIECRASALAPQALEYRKAKGMPTDAIAMGVLIQRMIQPVVAGVAFTINPVTGARDEMVINASWGIGEALVSGQVDPDEFVVAKDSQTVRWSRIGEKGRPDGSTTASLTTDHIGELAGMVLQIERHYGSPQDVEWCHDGERFWIVQSRPVTTARQSETEVQWTRANLAEVLPDLTSPQALTEFEELLDRAERQFVGKLVAPEAELGRIVQAFHGRLYFNLSQLLRLCAVSGASPALMLKSMGHADGIQSSDGATRRPPLRTILGCLPDLLRILRRHLRAADIVHQHEARTAAQLASFASVDPRSLSDDAVWAHIDDWSRKGPEFMQPVLLFGGVLFHEAPVWKACAAVGYPFEKLVYPQLATGGRSVSAQQAFDLVALADIARHEPAVRSYLLGPIPDRAQLNIALRGTEFLKAFDRFLQTYGHRGRYEYDWSLPRYHEDPSPLLQTVRAHLRDEVEEDGAATAVRQAREAEQAWADFEARLTRWQRWTLLPRVRTSIAKIKQYYIWREQVRSDLVRVLAVLRSWHLVLAERFVERHWIDTRDDYFLLRYSEIASVMRGQRQAETLRAIAADRTRELNRLRPLQMPLLMRASELSALIRHAGVSGGADAEGELRGQAVSGGCVEAEVVVVRDPGDFDRMKRGAILVAPATDPSWTPLFTLASGVVVEVGGVLSHASTIAREYGLPALANVKHATRRLKTGERVRLDATNSVIQRLSSESHW
jgi:rifampicin phosphotransferase